MVEVLKDPLADYLDDLAIINTTRLESLSVSYHTCESETLNLDLMLN
jgi:hypothetical protein